MFLNQKIFLLFLTTLFLVFFGVIWYEIFVSGMPSYGSDSLYYYESGFFGVESCNTYHGSGIVCIYRFLGYHQLYFPFLLLTCILYVSVVVWRLSKIEGKLFYFASFCLLHPFISFAIARGLKETMLFLIIAITLMLPIRFQKTVGYFSIILTFIFLITSRPFGIYLSIVIATLSIFRPSRFMIYSGIALLLILISVIDLSYVAYLDSSFLVDSIESHALQYSFTDDYSKRVALLPAPLTFYIGPTPIRPLLAILGEFTYAFGSPGTIIILLIGSLFSLATIPYLKQLIISIHGLNFFARFNFFHALSFIAVYSLLYGGSVDTRHRAAFFAILGFTILWQYSTQRLKNKMNKIE